MKHRLISITFVLGVLPAVVSCEGGGEDHPAHAEDEAEAAAGNRIDIPPTVRSNLGITFADVERRRVERTMRVHGAFELQPLARSEYRSLLPGRIEFRVKQFDKVTPGTTLYEIRSPEWLKMRSEINVTRAAVDQALAKSESAEQRLAKLREAEFKRAELEARATELRAELSGRKAELEAVLENAARLLSLHQSPDSEGPDADDLLAPVERDGESVPRYRTIDWIEVNASKRGVVRSLDVSDGAFAGEATLVLTTIDPDKVRFRASALQSDLPHFRDGQSVRVVPPRADGADPNASVVATLTVGLEANPDHRTVTVYATPAGHPSWVRPGVSAFLEIPAESSGGMALAVPRTAVVKDGITHVFFKRDPSNPNRAIRVEADLGAGDGRWVELKSGVGPNDQVVIDGAYELKLATASSGSSQKGGHFHADGSFHAGDE